MQRVTSGRGVQVIRVGMCERTEDVETMRRSAYLFVVILCLAQACGRTPSSPSSLAILSTDRQSYVAAPPSGTNAAPSFTVITKYENVNDLPILLERIGGDSEPLVSYQQVGKDGVPIGNADGPFCGVCTGGDGFILQPGAIRTDTFTFSPSLLPAKYRVYIRAQLCTSTPNPISCGQELPLSDRVSTPFLVSSPP